MMGDMARWQFNLARLMQAVAWFAVALVGFRAMIAADSVKPWTFVICAALGAGIGTMFGRPVIGAVVGIVLILFVDVLLGLLMLTAGLGRFRL
jgi:hypothetical protein